MSIIYERLISFIKSKLRVNEPVLRAGSYKPCCTVTELVTRLTAINWPRDLKLILLIDDVDRLFQLDSNSFSVLLRLPEMVKLTRDHLESDLNSFLSCSWIIKYLWS